MIDDVNNAGRRRGHRPAAAAVTALVIAFGLLVWPAVLSGAVGVSEADDQRGYHEVVIRTMAAQWPTIDLVDYPSATTPGYHLLLAFVRHAAGADRTALQLLGSLFGLALLLVVHRSAARLVGPGRGVAVVLPLLGSSYFLGSAIWLTTDNAAWLFVALTVGGVALSAPTAARVARCSAWATLAVLVRQIHLWVAAPLWLALAAISPLGGRLPSVLRVEEARRRSWLVTLAVAALALMPFAVVVFFAVAWGGLVPPAFAQMHGSGINPAVAPLALALVGLFGLFFMPAFSTGGMRLARDPLAWTLVIASAAVALLVPTTLSHAAGRWGGLWIVADRMPVVAERSVLVAFAAALGGFVIAAAWRAVVAAGRSREGVLLGVSFLAWLAAQMVNTQAWQRYCEPIVLIELAWLATLAVSPRAPTTATPPPWWWVGPVLLGVIQLAVSVVVLYARLELE